MASTNQYQITEVLCHVVATSVFVLQETRPLNAVVIHFPENSSITKMPNVPPWYVPDTLCHMLRICVENDFLLPHADSHPWTECVAAVTAIHKIVHSLCDLLVRGVVLSESDADRKYHNEKFSIPVSVIHQLSLKFYIYFYIWASLHCCQNIISTMCHCSCSAVTCGKEPVSLNFLFMFSNVLQCGIQEPYHFHCKNSILNAYGHVFHL